MRPNRLLALAAALVLAGVGAMTPTSAGAADGVGHLTVSIVDAQGQPVIGQVTVLGVGRVYAGQAIGVSTYDGDVTPGDYAVVTVTPWGGLACLGVTSCDYVVITTADPVAPGALTVAAGQTVTRTIKLATPATLSGRARVGRAISVDYSPTMQAMASLGSGVYDFTPSVQWQRNGTPIAGATDDSYTPTGADSGKRLSALLSYTGLAATYLQQGTGAPLTTFTTNAVPVTKAPSKAFIRLGRPSVPASRHAKIRVDATAPGQLPNGKATVTVGRWTQTRALRNGVARFTAPLLKPGKYDVRATYLGSSTFARSQAKKRVLTITRR